MAGVAIVFRNGGGLCTGESYILVVFFDPFLHVTPFFPDVDFAALIDNPVDYAIPFLLSRQCPLVALSVTEVPY